MVQDEVTWLLETIKRNWPGYGETCLYGDGIYGEGVYFDPYGFPDDIVRINRDEPKILETGERTRSVELSNTNAIGASLSSRDPTPVGAEYNHRVETTISIRFEGLHVSEFGHIKSPAHFEQLVRYAQHAIAQERSYPTVGDVDDDPIGSVAYHTISPPENETDLSDDNRDYFRRDWEYRFIGYSNQP
ncbi:hypothetical protein RBH26_20585 [Natronolimnohabitans sp. A-GB9]|uniref:hypothetical protein n=1 Tax=Natronolimnohabitans sp. A-GB9 TaxID=3069757 RepID=UPI0027B48839|nr:hypothetical protein [Natronolimnohabitans sp. A-GB9]MDQ2052842.1 hypothetical protein [Natronolimnohabitans sp. A-GB9]